MSRFSVKSESIQRFKDQDFEKYKNPMERERINGTQVHIIGKENTGIHITAFVGTDDSDEFNVYTYDKSNPDFPKGVYNHIASFESINGNLIKIKPWWED